MNISHWMENKVLKKKCETNLDLDSVSGRGHPYYIISGIEATPTCCSNAL